MDPGPEMMELCEPMKLEVTERWLPMNQSE